MTSTLLSLNIDWSSFIDWFIFHLHGTMQCHAERPAVPEIFSWAHTRAQSTLASGFTWLCKPHSGLHPTLAWVVAVFLALLHAAFGNITQCLSLSHQFWKPACPMREDYCDWLSLSSWPPPGERLLFWGPLHVQGFSPLELGLAHDPAYVVSGEAEGGREGGGLFQGLWGSRGSKKGGKKAKVKSIVWETRAWTRMNNVGIKQHKQECFQFGYYVLLPLPLPGRSRQCINWV